MVYTHCNCNMIASLTYGVNSTSNIGIFAQRLRLFRRFPLLCLHSTKQPPWIFIIDWAHIIFFWQYASEIGNRGRSQIWVTSGNPNPPNYTLNPHLKMSLTSPLAPLISTHFTIWANVRNQNIVMTLRLCVPNFLWEGPWQPWTVGALLADSQGPYSGGSHTSIRFSSYTWNYCSDDGAKVLRQKTDFLSSKRCVDVKNASVSFPASRRNARHTNIARE